MKNITIKETTHKKLKKIAEKNNISMSAFLENAVIYFDKTKLNPATDILSVKEEIQKLSKRVNQIVGFFRVFENEKLTPLYKDIRKINLMSVETYKKLPTDEDVQKIKEIL